MRRGLISLASLMRWSAYLPMASLYGEEWLGRTEKFFDGLARVEMLNTEMMELPEMESICGVPRWFHSRRQHFSSQSSFACQPLDAVSIQEDTSWIAAGLHQRRNNSVRPNILTSQ